jgi:hypothetical protein
MVGWYLHHSIHWRWHFLLMSADFFALVFTNVVYIHPVRSRFWMLVTVSSCYSLERGWPSGLQSPSSPFAYSYVPHWCSLCPSALVHSCHMASPVPLQTASPLPRCPSCYFSFQRSSLCVFLSIQLAAFHVPSPIDKFDVPLFLLREFVTYNRLYNAAHVSCGIAKFKKTHVYRASDPNASGLLLRGDLFEHLSHWANLTGTNVCRLSYLDQQESLSGFSYFRRYKSMLGWATTIGSNLCQVDLSWLNTFMAFLKTTAGHISNCITIVSFEVLSTSLLIILRIDVSVNYRQHHYRNHNLEQTHSYTQSQDRMAKIGKSLYPLTINFYPVLSIHVALSTLSLFNINYSTVSTRKALTREMIINHELE